MDHIGGISDFPDAQIHTTTAELLGAVREPTFREKVRFRAPQWAHGPKLVEHDPDGEKWRGFAAAKELTEISPGIVLVSLPGHTRGHACIAVDAGHRWVLQCGDAFYHPGTVDGTSTVPSPIKAIEPLLAYDRKRVRDNHARLTELYQRREPDLLMVCAHDPTLYEHAKATA
jgi:glyoxylase-like metal-dependent hydrolase (beta-lactamase superfamily II)